MRTPGAMFANDPPLWFHNAAPHIAIPRNMNTAPIIINIIQYWVRIVTYIIIYRLHMLIYSGIKLYLMAFPPASKDPKKAAAAKKKLAAAKKKKAAA